jgi:MFS family permease
MGISYTQAGALMSFFGLPGIIISIPGGILTDIYGSKKVGIVSLIIALAGSLLVGLGNSFSILVAGRVITGIGALTISIVAPQALSQWFIKDDLGKAMGIFNAAMPLGSILTLNLYGLLAAAYSWKIPLLLTSLFCLVVLILFVKHYLDQPEEVEITEEKKKLEFKEDFNIISQTSAQIWLVAGIWMVYNASSIAYLTFGADYYQSIGYDIGYAGFLTSLLMVGSLIFSPLVGMLTDKLGSEEFLVIIGSIALAALLFLVPRTLVNPLIIGGLIGFFAAFIPAPVFAMVPKNIPLNKTGLGYGILSTCLNIGVLVGPFLVGYSFDRTKNYLFGFNLMAFFALVAVIFASLLLFRKIPKKMEKD